jgi:hypothetical protein
MNRTVLFVEVVSSLTVIGSPRQESGSRVLQLEARPTISALQHNLHSGLLVSRRVTTSLLCSPS